VGQSTLPAQRGASPSAFPVVGARTSLVKEPSRGEPRAPNAPCIGRSSTDRSGSARLRALSRPHRRRWRRLHPHWPRRIRSRRPPPHRAQVRPASGRSGPHYGRMPRIARTSTLPSPRPELAGPRALEPRRRSMPRHSASLQSSRLALQSSRDSPRQVTTGTGPIKAAL
jgi:hypothetical protein